MIYPLIKLNREKQKKLLATMIGILCTLVYVWYLLLGAELWVNTAITESNTKYVAEDSNAVSVEHINEDGDLYLSNMLKVKGSDVNTYIRTQIGSGVYYLGDDRMSAEITRDDALRIGTKAMVLDWVVFFMVIALLLSYKKKWFYVLAVIHLIFDLLLYKYYLLTLVRSDFPISWCLVGRFLIFIILMNIGNIRRRILRKRGVV